MWNGLRVEQFACGTVCVWNGLCVEVSEMKAAIAPVTRKNCVQNANASKSVNESDVVNHSVDFVRHEAALHRRRAEMTTNKIRVNKQRMDMLKKEKQERGDDFHSTISEYGNAVPKKSIRTHMF